MDVYMYMLGGKAGLQGTPAWCLPAKRRTRPLLRGRAVGYRTPLAAPALHRLIGTYLGARRASAEPTSSICAIAEGSSSVGTHSTRVACMPAAIGGEWVGADAQEVDRGRAPAGLGRTQAQRELVLPPSSFSAMPLWGHGERGWPSEQASGRESRYPVAFLLLPMAMVACAMHARRTCQTGVAQVA